MSHNKERAEKVCLNCGAELHGRYCHQCGQENLEPKESFWHLITHYAYDITHFDGKFFATLKYLILRPGFLPAEYLKGHRTSYLHPIRMYVFTSAFFFIIFFSLFHLDHVDVNGTGKWVQDSSHVKAIEVQQELLKTADDKEDSARILRALKKLQRVDVERLKDTTGKGNRGFNIIREKSSYHRVSEYDSAQAALPPDDRDGWLQRRIMHRQIAIWQKYNGDTDAMTSAWIEKFMHLFPQMLFVSLPLFAFVLWLLYFRRRNELYYTGHVVFTLYLYIFYFIAYLVFFLLQKGGNATGWSVFGWVELVLWLYMTYYMYKSLRGFYAQGRLKTIVKLLLLLTVNFFLFLFLFVVFTIFSVYQV